MNTDIDTSSSTSPAPVDHLKGWLSAAYGRVGNVTEKYPFIVFTQGAEARVMQIAGWMSGLVHAGKRELAEAAAKDLNARFEYLNGYGGDVEASFEDGSPVLKIPRYMVQLGDDATFGGFTVAWFRAVREGSDGDGDRTGFLRNRWNSLVDMSRWGAQSDPRDRANFYFKFDFNGGLLYHGPGGGETFSVTLGDVSFWSIHT